MTTEENITTTTELCVHGQSFPCAQCLSNRTHNERTTGHSMSEVEFRSQYLALEGSLTQRAKVAIARQNFQQEVNEKENYARDEKRLRKLLIGRLELEDHLIERIAPEESPGGRVRPVATVDGLRFFLSGGSGSDSDYLMLIGECPNCHKEVAAYVFGLTVLGENLNQFRPSEYTHSSGQCISDTPVPALSVEDRLLDALREFIAENASTANQFSGVPV